MTHIEFQNLIRSLARESDDTRLTDLLQGYEELYEIHAINERTIADFKDVSKLKKIAACYGVDLDDRDALESAFEDVFGSGTNMTAIAAIQLDGEGDGYLDCVDRFMFDRKHDLQYETVRNALKLLDEEKKKKK
jgi:hypothetical protein